MPAKSSRRPRARPPKSPAAAPPGAPLSNAELARRLTGLAQLLSAQGENPFKVRAYRRAAETVAGLGQSLDAAIRAGEDITHYPGIGAGIAAALREIVLTGKLGQMELLLQEATPELALVQEFPRLDPRRVKRVFQKLGIDTLEELRERLAAGEIAEKFGATMADHFLHALNETTQILLYDAEPLAAEIAQFLRRAGARRAEPAGEYRRRVEVIGELAFVVETDDFPRLVAALRKFGGAAEVEEESETRATARLPIGITLRVTRAEPETWGLAQVIATGSNAHLEKLGAAKLARLTRSAPPLPDEPAVYRQLGLDWVPPELREGGDEVALARQGRLPVLVELADIRGDLHAHTTSSDGSHNFLQMAEAARAKGYEYLGITDHSQSLKIARGVSEDDLWKQIRAIDRANARLKGIRLLKSAEVDILADGRLDYSDELLAALDYTVCSIHSRFRLGRREQTERLLRAMDHPAFGILGHATGRLLLKRTGYEIDLERIITHARERGCAFEINASPDRLDLSAESARLVAAAGIRIAVNTDAHHLRELNYMACGLDVARRAGLTKADVLNCLPLAKLLRALKKSASV